MEDAVKKYLLDIWEAIGHIEGFTEGVASFAAYEKNLMVSARDLILPPFGLYRKNFTCPAG